MTDTNVIKLAQPGTFTDSLTEILRNGAHALLTQAVEMEVADFLGRYSDLKTEAGHQRVVRHLPVLRVAKRILTNNLEGAKLSTVRTSHGNCWRGGIM